MKKQKKGLVALAAVLMVAISAIGAYAYFTTTASGPGSAAVGTSTALTISSATTSTPLYPGGPNEAISFSITNSSPGFQYVGIVSATVTAVYDSTDAVLIDENGVGPNQNLCATTNFATQAGAIAVGSIPGGVTFNSSSAPTTRPVVGMVNSNSIQDGCKNAKVHLSLSSS